MEKATGIKFIGLAILAFAALGLEVVLAFGIEPVIFGTSMNEWSDTQIIIHWVVTCLLWCSASLGISQYNVPIDVDIKFDPNPILWTLENAPIPIRGHRIVALPG